MHTLGVGTFVSKRGQLVNADATAASAVPVPPLLTMATCGVPECGVSCLYIDNMWLTETY